MEAGSFEVVELSDSEDERNGVVNSRQVNGSSSCGSEKVPGSTAVPDKGVDVIESAAVVTRRAQLLEVTGSDSNYSLQDGEQGKASRLRPTTVPEVEHQENGEVLAAADGVFNQVILNCEKLLRLPDDNLIVAKLKRYYTATTLDFRDSTECQELLKNFIEKTNDKNPEVYLVIKQLLHELDKYRGVPSSRVSKLEKLLQKLDKKIKKVQEREVEWSDPEKEDSIYLYECRLKERFTKVYEMICELTGSKKRSGRMLRSKIVFESTRYPDINDNISKFVNKTGSVPDYSEVLSVVRQTNTKGGNYLSDLEVDKVAREAFLAVGEKLKKIRLRDLGFTLLDEADSGEDPAERDADLKKRLEENGKIAKQKLNEVIERYVAEQDANKSACDDSNEDPSESSSDEEEEDDQGSRNGLNEEDEDDRDSKNGEEDEEEEASLTEELSTQPSVEGDFKNEDDTPSCSKRLAPSQDPLQLSKKPRLDESISDEEIIILSD